ncbi:hypothetical protein L596_015773 [Steinernema carpocapsae]|uniref:Uncharacterized protein n=1 Tax=Steinernema carpocapsae TaxID=34508 RepID=A0A4V6A378_STECR|nr:hypothetical protein L596_015773 [Steinernema carpocapsae]
MRSAALSVLILLSISCFLWQEAFAKDGGTSIAGVGVDCYPSMSACADECYFECYEVDHCNDSDSDAVACAPDVTVIALYVLGITIGVTMLCCFVCVCSPCCLIASCIQKAREKRKNRRYRNESTKDSGALI